MGLTIDCGLLGVWRIHAECQGIGTLQHNVDDHPGYIKLKSYRKE